MFRGDAVCARVMLRCGMRIRAGMALPRGIELAKSEAKGGRKEALQRERV